MSAVTINVWWSHQAQCVHQVGGVALDVFFVWEPLQPHRQDVDKLNKVYEGVVEDAHWQVQS
jgi:hypothetical protein